MISFDYLHTLERQHDSFIGWTDDELMQTADELAEILDIPRMNLYQQPNAIGFIITIVDVNGMPTHGYQIKKELLEEYKSIKKMFFAMYNFLGIPVDHTDSDTLFTRHVKRLMTRYRGRTMSRASILRKFYMGNKDYRDGPPVPKKKGKNKGRQNIVRGKHNHHYRR